MSKQTIILADSSYTIRRIVELSFSEEEGIELISFENGSTLKNKLLELRPAGILVDIKLPEINGYEICQFINTTPELKQTKVFLMKGGFEPVDEKILERLKYVEIITKPFDSNALVSSVKKHLTEPSGKEAPTITKPAGIPSGVEENDFQAERDEEISFADIKEEIDNAEYGKDDVLPSEEITQGTAQDKDRLANADTDELENPFKNDSSISGGAAPSMPEEDFSDEEAQIKEHIRQQESELDLQSLTQEALSIKKIMDEKKKLTIPVPEIIKKEINIPVEQIPPPLEEPGEPIPAMPVPEPAMKAPEVGFPEPEEIPMVNEEEIPEMNHQVSYFQEPGEIVTSPEEPVEEEELSTVETLKITPGEEEIPEIGHHLAEEKEAETYEGDLFSEKPAGVQEPEPSGSAISEPPDEEEETNESQFNEDLLVDEHAGEEPAVSRQEKLGMDAGESGIPMISKEELMAKAEEKLTIVIKDILWEIIPPLAEKIIKKEIESLKSQLEETSV